MKKKLLKQILKRLDEIEQGLKQVQPVITPPYDPPDYLGDATTCIKCGMQFKGITSYYCSVPGCPTFMVPTCSVSTTTNSSYENTRARRDNMSSPGDKSYED